MIWLTSCYCSDLISYQLHLSSWFSSYIGLPHQTCQVCSTWETSYLLPLLSGMFSPRYLCGLCKCSSGSLIKRSSYSIIYNISLYGYSLSFPHLTWVQTSSHSAIIHTYFFIRLASVSFWLECKLHEGRDFLCFVHHCIPSIYNTAWCIVGT